MTPLHEGCFLIFGYPHMTTGGNFLKAHNTWTTEGVSQEAPDFCCTMKCATPVAYSIVIELVLYKLFFKLIHNKYE
jgi:hypothetical protein